MSSSPSTSIRSTCSDPRSDGSVFAGGRHFGQAGTRQFVGRREAVSTSAAACQGNEGLGMLLFPGLLEEGGTSLAPLCPGEQPVSAGRELSAAGFAAAAAGLAGAGPPAGAAGRPASLDAALAAAAVGPLVRAPYARRRPVAAPRTHSETLSFRSFTGLHPDNTVGPVHETEFVCAPGQPLALTVPLPELEPGRRQLTLQCSTAVAPHDWTWAEDYRPPVAATAAAGTDHLGSGSAHEKGYRLLDGRSRARKALRCGVEGERIFHGPHDPSS